MGDEDPRFARESTDDRVEEKSLADTRIESGQGVIEDDDVGVEVYRTGDVDSLLLSAR